MITNRIYEKQNLLSVYFVSFLVGLRIYQHHCTYCFSDATMVARKHLNVGLYVHLLSCFFTMEAECIPCEVRPEFLCVIYMKVKIKSIKLAKE